MCACACVCVCVGREVISCLGPVTRDSDFLIRAKWDVDGPSATHCSLKQCWKHTHTHTNRDKLVFVT